MDLIDEGRNVEDNGLEPDLKKNSGTLEGHSHDLDALDADQSVISQVSPC